MSRVQEQDAVDLAAAGGQYVEEQKRPRPAALPRAGRRRGSRRRRAGDRRPGRAGAGGHGPGRAAEHGHQPAARFRPGRARRTSISGIRTSSRSIRRSTASRSRTRRSSACGPARSGPRARPGTARAATWSGATSRTTGRCAGSRTTATCRVFRYAVEQQQRQHLRLPGPADLLRASDPARGPLRARRLGDGARGLVRGQAAQLAQRRRSPSRRQHLVHRPAIRQPALRRRARRGRRPEQCRRAGSTPASASPPASAPSGSASCRPRPTVWTRAARSTVVATEDAGAGPQRPVLLARLQAAVRRQHRQGTGRHRGGRQGQHLRLRRQRRQQARRTSGCSPTAWSTA